MRLFATIILAALLCATASAQTLKSLMYNTNGQVVYGSASALRFESENLQSVYFTDIFAQNIEAGIDTNSVAFGPLGIDFAGVAAANTRTNLGLGATNDVVFQSVKAGNDDPFVVFDNLGFTIDSTNTNTGAAGIAFIGAGANRMAANTRANLGLPLAALTNTSNVTIMRALSGSTNTNEPYSGSISVVGTNNTNTLVFSNGILQSVQ